MFNLTDRKQNAACGYGLAALALLLTACDQLKLSGAALDSPPPTPVSRTTPTADILVMIVTPAATPAPEATTRPLASPAELGAGQHISASGSYTETETQAAGPMLCRIERGSPAFYQLISDQDPAIIFSQAAPPPYADEVHLMHPAMLLPLTRLAKLVAVEWGGQVRLYVTAAYDSQLEHDLAQSDSSRRYSLHFEGRSIDVAPVPASTERYARLCALAHHAGFDWVHNEADHCHASVKAQSLCELYRWSLAPSS